MLNFSIIDKSTGWGEPWRGCRMLLFSWPSLPILNNVDEPCMTAPEERMRSVFNKRTPTLLKLANVKTNSDKGRVGDADKRLLHWSTRHFFWIKNGCHLWLHPTRFTFQGASEYVLLCFLRSLPPLYNWSEHIVWLKRNSSRTVTQPAILTSS